MAKTQSDKAILIRRGQIAGKLGNEKRFYASLMKKPDKDGEMVDYGTEWKEKD